MPIDTASPTHPLAASTESLGLPTLMLRKSPWPRLGIECMIITIIMYHAFDFIKTE